MSWMEVAAIALAALGVCLLQVVSGIWRLPSWTHGAREEDDLSHDP